MSAQLRLATPTKPAPDFVGVKEIAKFLNLKPRSIYEKVAQKKIPFHKPTGKLLFDLNEIIPWSKGERK
ncbi:MAG: helix-turn-helix domain-containing protein [Pyrinomonadaceae bacterium]